MSMLAEFFHDLAENGTLKKTRLALPVSKTNGAADAHVLDDTFNSTNIRNSYRSVKHWIQLGDQTTWSAVDDETFV